MTRDPANTHRISNAERIRAEILTRSERLVALEKAADWEAAARVFTDDAVFQAAGAPQVVGRDAILAAYRSFPPVSDFEGVSSEIVPASGAEMAYEYGVNRFVFDTPEESVVSVGKYLAVWRKIEGEWFVAALAFSADAPTAPR